METSDLLKKTAKHSTLFTKYEYLQIEFIIKIVFIFNRNVALFYPDLRNS